MPATMTDPSHPSHYAPCSAFISQDPSENQSLSTYNPSLASQSSSFLTSIFFQQPTISQHLTSPHSRLAPPSQTPTNYAFSLSQQQQPRLNVQPPGFRRHGSAFSAPATFAANYWPMSDSGPHTGMGGSTASHTQGLKRARSHQRIPSASTVASNGPTSPYMQTLSHPHIANPDYSPNTSSAFLADQPMSFAKSFVDTPQDTEQANLLNLGIMPSQTAHMPSAHLAMKDFAIDHHLADQCPPEFAPSRHSVSSMGHDSPQTPQSGSGEADSKPANAAPQLPRAVSRGISFADVPDARPQERNIRLCRTESEAFTDELYNPALFSAPAVKKAPKTFLSPQRNLISERLQSANLARSTSPNPTDARDQPSMINGHEAASARGWRASGMPITTAASIRRQQKEEAEQAEYAQHRPQLQREPTKTISPKDALLELPDSDSGSLFQDAFPVGYRSHMGGTEQWPSNNYFSQTNNTAFGSMPAQPFTFRNATPADGSFSEQNFDFSAMVSTSDDTTSAEQYSASFPAAIAAKLNPSSTDTTPDFPAALPSMETSLSDLGHAPSSQESMASFAPTRPADTRANTGTYTCTYHGCTRRFDSHQGLQKHKREYHRSQQHHEHVSPVASSASPQQQAESPDSPEAGMSNEAIMARNSQAGPHKCTRINPSTGKPCNTVFSRPYDLTRHEDTIHNNRKQKVRCQLCREEKTFSRHDALTRHMRVVHPEVDTQGKRSRRD